ncbi:MAG: hypothetical protein EP329_27915, partial [Deltaproteobacteria bacterium]
MSMRRLMLVPLLVVLAWNAVSEVRADVPPVADDPHDLADMALVARRAHDYGAAAALLDRAHDAAPHPLYRLGAGESYLADGDLERATTRLREALAAPDLP